MTGNLGTFSTRIDWNLKPSFQKALLKNNPRKNVKKREMRLLKRITLFFQNSIYWY